MTDEERRIRVESFIRRGCRTDDYIQKTVKYLHTLNYSFAAPLILANATSKASELVRNHIILTGEDTLALDASHQKLLPTFFQRLKTCISNLSMLAENLRYVQSAENDRMPWSMADELISTIGKLLPDEYSSTDVVYLLRPQWHYNYSVKHKDLREYYFIKLKSIFPIKEVGEKKVNEAIKDMNKKFIVITFPASERMNTMNHVILGHEIGHIVTDYLLSQPHPDDTNTKFSTYYMNKIKKLFPEVKASNALEDNNEEPEIVIDTFKAWKYAFSEYISDYVATRLWGLSFATATLSHSYITNETTKLKNIEGHPTWDSRLHIISKAIEDMKLPLDSLLNKINETFATLGNDTYDPYIKTYFKDEDGKLDLDSQKIIKLINFITSSFAYDKYNFEPVIVETLQKDQIEAIQTAYKLFPESVDKAITVLESLEAVKKEFVTFETLNKQLPNALIALAMHIPPISKNVIIENNIDRKNNPSFDPPTIFFALWILNECSNKNYLVKEEFMKNLNRLGLWSFHANHLYENFLNTKS